MAEFTEDKLRDMFEQCNVNSKYYQLALFAQSALETGYGTSNLYREHNNLFGMAPAQIRKKFYEGTTTVPEGIKATYANPHDSIHDRVDLDKYNKIPAPQSYAEIEDYVQAVYDAGYAEDPEYVKKWLETIGDVDTAYLPYAASAEEREDTGRGLGSATFGTIIIGGLVLASIFFPSFRKFLWNTLKKIIPFVK